MERTARLLRYIYLLFIAVSVSIVVFFETDVFEEGVLACGGGHSEFVITTVMELVTICVVPVALRMFKFQRMKRLLRDSPGNLFRYGSLRITMLSLPMAVNTLFYYLYVSVAFGYMALILLLAGAFIYPSTSRCENETGAKKREE